MPKKIRHEGKHKLRLRSPMSNALEIAFAKKWKELQKSSRLLETLMRDAKGQRGRGDLDELITQRDAVVAATIVQWLGSTVGTEFIQECLEKVPRRVEPYR